MQNFINYLIEKNYFPASSNLKIFEDEKKVINYEISQFLGKDSKLEFFFSNINFENSYFCEKSFFVLVQAKNLDEKINLLHNQYFQLVFSFKNDEYLVKLSYFPEYHIKNIPNFFIDISLLNFKNNLEDINNFFDESEKKEIFEKISFWCEKFPELLFNSDFPSQKLKLLLNKENMELNLKQNIKKEIDKFL